MRGRAGLARRQATSESWVAKGGGGSGSQEAVEQLVREQQVVVFMKDSTEQPLYGFSSAIVQILLLHGTEDYCTHNILQDPNLRQGIKNYFNWPTIPQVYFNGEFVGGCDVLLQMCQNGDLVEDRKNLGICSALLDEEKAKTKRKMSKKDAARIIKQIFDKNLLPVKP